MRAERKGQLFTGTFSRPQPPDKVLMRALGAEKSQALLHVNNRHAESVYLERVLAKDGCPSSSEMPSTGPSRVRIPRGTLFLSVFLNFRKSEAFLTKKTYICGDVLFLSSRAADLSLLPFSICRYSSALLPICEQEFVLLEHSECSTDPGA